MSVRVRGDERGLTMLETIDKPRLETLLDLVSFALDDGEWWTLFGIRNFIGRGSEAGISARIRELRGMGHKIERRRRGDPKLGLWEYRKAEQ